MSDTTDGTSRLGRFISFEGGEGAGKSTQVLQLADRLAKSLGVEVVTTREPGGTPGAEAIRHLLVTGSADRWSATSEALLLYAARVDLWTQVIHPALQSGRWVICDRFADSTLAYQGIAGGMGVDRLRKLHEIVLPGAWPDLTLVLDIDPSVGLGRAIERAKESGGDASRFEKLDMAHHQRVARGFRTLAEQEPDRITVIDASQSVDAVSTDIWRQVSQLLARAEEAP